MLPSEPLCNVHGNQVSFPGPASHGRRPKIAEAPRGEGRVHLPDSTSAPCTQRAAPAPDPTGQNGKSHYEAAGGFSPLVGSLCTGVSRV